MAEGAVGDRLPPHLFCKGKHCKIPKKGLFSGAGDQRPVLVPTAAREEQIGLQIQLQAVGLFFAKIPGGIAPAPDAPRKDGLPLLITRKDEGHIQIFASADDLRAPLRVNRKSEQAGLLRLPSDLLPPALAGGKGEGKHQECQQQGNRFFLHHRYLDFFPSPFLKNRERAFARPRNVCSLSGKHPYKTAFQTAPSSTSSSSPSGSCSGSGCSSGSITSSGSFSKLAVRVRSSDAASVRTASVLPSLQETKR